MYFSVYISINILIIKYIQLEFTSLLDYYSFGLQNFCHSILNINPIYLQIYGFIGNLPKFLPSKYYRKFLLNDSVLVICIYFVLYHIFHLVTQKKSSTPKDAAFAINCFLCELVDYSSTVTFLLASIVINLPSIAI